MKLSGRIQKVVFAAVVVAACGPSVTTYMRQEPKMTTLPSRKLAKLPDTVFVVTQQQVQAYAAGKSEDQSVVDAFEAALDGRDLGGGRYLRVISHAEVESQMLDAEFTAKLAAETNDWAFVCGKSGAALCIYLETANIQQGSDEYCAEEGGKSQFYYEMRGELSITADDWMGSLEATSGHLTTTKLATYRKGGNPDSCAKVFAPESWRNGRPAICKKGDTEGCTAASKAFAMGLMDVVATDHMGIPAKKPTDKPSWKRSCEVALADAAKAQSCAKVEGEGKANLQNVTEQITQTLPKLDQATWSEASKFGAECRKLSTELAALGC